MSTQVRESVSNLKVGYSHQVEESERQNYSSTQVSLSEDKSPIRLEKKLKIEGSQKAKKILIFDKTKVSVFRLYFHLSNKFDFFFDDIRFSRFNIYRSLKSYHGIFNR